MDGETIPAAGPPASPPGEAAGVTIAAAPDAVGRILDLLAAGGPVVAILLAMSIAALAILLVKLWQFRSLRIGDTAPARTALALYRAGRAREALIAVERSRNPVARVMAHAMRGAAMPHVGEDRVREEIARFGNEIVEALRSWLRPLEVIASLAPLLGLFGTVLGMITAFQRLEAAGNRVDPAILSGGIWEALLTTAAGLAVAIPTVVAVNWLERRIDRLAHDMDSLVLQIFTEDLSPAAYRESRPGPRPVAVPAGD